MLHDHLDIARSLLAHDCLDTSNGVWFRTRKHDWIRSKRFPDETVLEIARRKGQTEIVEILMSREDSNTLEAITARARSIAEQPNPGQVGTPSDADPKNWLDWESESNSDIYMDDSLDDLLTLDGDLSESSSGTSDW
jgi:hypothetical protein